MNSWQQEGRNHERSKDSLAQHPVIENCYMKVAAGEGKKDQQVKQWQVRSDPGVHTVEGPGFVTGYPGTSRAKVSN